MTSPPSLFHALLRPSILQILRSTGYHSTRPAVLDTLTDIAARYLALLCQNAAMHAQHNHGDSGDFTVADVRMALQDAGALGPQRVLTEEEWMGEEDLRGVEDFVRWFAGARMKEMMEFGSGDGESDATDYLMVLKKKHSQTGDGVKYQGTVLGRDNDAGGEVQVEGGQDTSISNWITKRSGKLPALQEAPAEEGHPQTNGHLSDDDDSNLSSVGDRLENEDEMDLS